MGARTTRALWITGLCVALAGPAGAAPGGGEVEEALARIALMERGRSLGRGRLAGYLKAAQPQVAAAAARALGRVQDPAAEAALAQALGHADPSVRGEVAFALGQLPEVDPAPLVARLKVEADGGVRDRLIEALGKALDGPAAEPLAAIANDPSAPAAERARARVGLALIAKRGKGPVPVDAAALGRWLAEPEAPARRAAAYVLQRLKGLKGPAAQALAERCAADDDAVVRLRCVWALTRFDAAAAVLAKASADPDWRVRAAAVQASADKAPALAQRLAGFAAELAEVDAPAWGDARLQPVLAALDAAARGAPDHADTLAAAKALWTAGSKALDRPGHAHTACRAAAVLDRARAKPRRLTKACKGLPAVLVEPLEVAVRGAAKPGARRDRALKAAFEALGPSGKAAALQALVEGAAPKMSEPAFKRGAALRRAVVGAALASGDPAVVSAGADAAAALGLNDLDEALLGAYRAMMAARELEAVQAVFQAFKRLKLRRSAAVLEAHLADPHPAVRVAAAEALKAVNPEARRRRRMPPAVAPAVEPNPDLARPSPWRVAVLHTRLGPVTLRLLADDARGTVKHFVALAQKGYFDGLSFHRVVPGFVVQGGDPRGDGWGGPGLTIPCEINPAPYVTGAVGMALAGKDTGGSQFFVTHAPHPHLDGRYTVFAQVTAGQAAADALLVGDTIQRVELRKR